VIDEFVLPEYRQSFLDAIREPQNFFKHVDQKNADKKLKFYYDVTKFFLLDAVLLCSKLTGRSTPEMHVFFVWFLMKYPKYFEVENPTLSKKLEEARSLDIGGFEVAVQCIDILRVRGWTST
jgi:hypothetical protein